MQVDEFDGRWCHGFSWQFDKATLNEVFGTPDPSVGGQLVHHDGPLASHIITRALELISEAGNRLNSVTDTKVSIPSRMLRLMAYADALASLLYLGADQLVKLHASVLFLRYLALRPRTEQTLALLDLAPACLLLVIKVYCQIGGRVLKEFYEVGVLISLTGQLGWGDLMLTRAVPAWACR